MLILPPVAPSAVNDRLPAEHTVSRFKSDAGLSVSVGSACRGHSVSFRLVYSKIDPAELGMLLKFWDEIGGSSAGSKRSFVIPECHPALRLVKEWAALRRQIIFDSQGNSWWIVTDRSPYGGDLCYLLDWTWTVENVYRRK